jgi:hypothetical protein
VAVLALVTLGDTPMIHFRIQCRIKLERFCFLYP